jgi:hypothetical protein
MTSKLSGTGDFGQLEASLPKNFESNFVVWSSV